MKVALINYSDINGGAARAAYRIHQALLQDGVHSRMHVNEARAGDWTVQRPSGQIEKAINKVTPALGGIASYLLKTTNKIIHSPAIIPSIWPQRLNRLDADVVHLHWVNGEMLSISGIGSIQKPIVWTLHDMWAFCGAEHYTEEFRWEEGYLKHNRPSYESGIDLNRWTWLRKRKHWTRPMHIVTPSRWLAECVRKSALMCDWPVTVVPNAIDTNLWKPIDKKLARSIQHLPADVPLLLFGALGGASDPRKGFDLMKSSLEVIRGKIPGLELIVFGSLAPRNLPNLGFPIHYTGHLNDDISMRLLYSAVDAMVVASRIEAFGQTASEAHSCGTPVIAFNTSGLPDIVDHEQTGYLATAYDVEDLAKGIQWVLSDAERHKVLSYNAREKAVNYFSYPVVVQQYLKVYEEAILNFNAT